VYGSLVLDWFVIVWLPRACWLWLMRFLGSGSGFGMVTDDDVDDFTTRKTVFRVGHKRTLKGQKWTLIPI
jgi:hypothetical protein